MYIIGTRGGKNCLLGHHFAWQDFQVILPLVMSDPATKTLSELVKEVFPDATKKQKPSQPKTGEENAGVSP
jgi:hypothetical protein